MRDLEFDPGQNCALCPRLKAYRDRLRTEQPSWHNGPVDTWVAAAGASSVRLLIAGLAPGVKGANRTGRPFTGDYAGDLLYSTLEKFGFAHGTYDARPDDTLELHESAITNVVRCVPPQNKPVGAEINACREFVVPTLQRFPNLKAIVSLGKISHDSIVRALGARIAALPFGHASSYEIDGLRLFSSYHCSRYNTNTGRLTTNMFEAVFADVRRFLDQS